MTRPMQDRLWVATKLREIAALLELQGAKPFRARAYQRGAVVVEGLADPQFESLVTGQRLSELPNIGPALSRVIAELALTGALPLLESLRSEFPQAVVALSELPALSVDRARALHEALHLSSLDELAEACRKGEVRKVFGFGPATERKLLLAIERHREHATKILLHQALPIAEGVARYLRGNAPNANVNVTGQIRRQVEVIDEIALLVAQENDHSDTALASFASYPMVTQVESRLADRLTARLADGVRVVVHTVPRESFGLAMMRTTGPIEHVEAIESRAAKCGVDLSRAPSEEALYASLGLAYLPPETRELPDAVTTAHAASIRQDRVRVVEVAEIRGAVHCHTTDSDGRDSLEAMARGAAEFGFSYLTITDHSPAAHYANGLDLDRLKRQWDDIERVRELGLGLTLFRGTESDILADGALDYPPAILEQLDVVIASIHARHRLDRHAMTERLVRAMRAPVFKIWGHPLGRLLLRRDPIDCDIEHVLDVAAEEGTVAIEINGDPHRLDLEPRWIRAAKERGLKFVVSSDAHSVSGFAISATAWRWLVAEASRLPTCSTPTRARHSPLPSAHRPPLATSRSRP